MQDPAETDFAFTISSGDIDRYSDGGAGKSGRIIVHNDLGALMHSCWTYWGSSGAPIFNRKSGEIVGIHNSWDPSCGQRHAVGVEGINFCVDDMLKMQVRWKKLPRQLKFLYTRSSKRLLTEEEYLYLLK